MKCAGKDCHLEGTETREVPSEHGTFPNRLHVCPRCASLIDDMLSEGKRASGLSLVPPPPPTFREGCAVCGVLKVLARGLCQRHYRQLQREGRLDEAPQRKRGPPSRRAA